MDKKTLDVHDEFSINEEEKIMLGIKLTHVSKILFSEIKLGKGALAEYYFEYMRWIFPHLKNRPLAISRCPHGIASSCFYQKHIESLPSSIGRVKVVEKK